MKKAIIISLTITFVTCLVIIFSLAHYFGKEDNTSSSTSNSERETNALAEEQTVEIDTASKDDTILSWLADDYLEITCIANEAYTGDSVIDNAIETLLKDSRTSVYTYGFTFDSSLNGNSCYAIFDNSEAFIVRADANNNAYATPIDADTIIGEDPDPEVYEFKDTGFFAIAPIIEIPDTATIRSRYFDDYGIEDPELRYCILAVMEIVSPGETITLGSDFCTTIYDYANIYSIKTGDETLNVVVKDSSIYVRELVNAEYDTQYITEEEILFTAMN